MSNVKQVIVVRKDLNMRKGKMCAQAAHASLKVLLDLMSKNTNIISGERTRTLKYYNDHPLAEWLDGSFTKICLSVNSEAELDEIYNKANSSEMPIPCALIIDSGKTEFNSVPTKTCCAIGPYYSEDIDKITGHLSLL